MKRLLAIMTLFTAAHAGAGFLFRRRRRAYAGSRKHFLVTQGGTHIRPTADEIRDAVISVLMGGALLDLREVHLKERPARLDLMSIMGGVELIVPEDWRVQTDVETVMGGVEDTRPKRLDPERPVDLLITGQVVMGGLDIASTLPGRAGRWVKAPRVERPADVSD